MKLLASRRMFGCGGMGGVSPSRYGCRFRSPSVVILLMALSWVAVGLPGCSPLNFNLSDFSFNNDDKPVTPTRMIPVWTDTVLTRAGKKGVRGFGGRIVFYQEKRTEPVHVDGTIIVYAWDDTDGKALSEVPDRKYVITAEELPHHFSESRVGPSYSIWIPWEEAGGEHRKVTLVTRFVGINGAEVVSESIDAVLPGPTDDRIMVEEHISPPAAPASLEAPDVALHESVATPGSRGKAIQQASWQSGTAPSEIRRDHPRMKTTTLDVSPSFAARHFRDNSIPLNSETQRSGHHGLPLIEAAAAVSGHAERLPPPVNPTEAPGPAHPRPRVRSSQTARPAQSGRPTQPGHSPLRSQPRRAAWQPRPRATPQSLPGPSRPPFERPSLEAGDLLPSPEQEAAQTQP